MKDRITQLFLQYLKSCNVSEKTLRYYKSDLALFTAWLVFKIKSLGADCENLQEALPFLTNKTAEEYKEFLIKNGNSVQTINRRLSTLRILSKFLLDTNLLSFNFAKNIKNISKAVMVPPLERAAAEFSNYLEAQKASFLTRKNYLADINQFLRFIEKQSKKDLQEITSKDIKRYLIIELASSPETTKDRKISSLKKFFSWAKEEKKTNINPVEDYLKDTAYLKPIEKSLSEITEPSINRKVFGNYPSYEGLKARINAYLAGKPRLQKLVYHILYTRPKWYKAYHSLAISRYLNFAILVIFATGLGFGVYQQLFAKPQTPIAYPSQPVPPKRYLSFQGRLTNQYQTPITTPTNIVFKLYDASTGGNTLWNSAGVACSVDPDEDGIFSILLGTTSGDGYTCTGISPIDSSVFTENAEVWLGIKVGSDPEATPRIQIATVAYALNAETLQGYPIDATGSATKNTVLTMNSGGEVVLAEVGPKIKSVSGNFSVQGEAVTIQANGGGVAGDITLSPASDGTVSILASGTTNDSLYIQNAQITSGALIHGYYGGTSTTVDLLKLGAGATESTKFLVESSGDTFIASGADLFIGGIGLNDNSSNSSGASLIGLYDDNMTYISGNTNVQSAIKQLDTAIGTLTGSAGGWTDDGTIVRLTTSSDRVGIGTTSVNSNTKVGILGNLAIGSQTYSDAQAPTNGLIVEGNVGIGTTAPTAKLDVAGDILVNNGGSIDTRAAGTLTIGGTTQTGLTVGRSGATTTINGSSVVINSLSGIIQGSSGTISAITGTANYVPRWSSSAPYLTSTSTIFDNGTNVGIGTTVPTKGKLNVLGSVAIGSTAYTETSGAAPANGLIVEGRVGIATTNPQGILHLITTGSDIPIMATTQTVSATPSSILSFKVNTSANIGRIGAVSVNSIDTFLLSGTSAKQIGLSSNSSSTPDLLITTDGNVGIGATAPTAKLDVAGNILVQGGGSIDTRAAGTLTIGGTTQTGLTVGRSGATTTINGSSVVINSLSGIIQGSSGTISAITGTANYVPRWSSSAPYLTSTSTIFDNGTNVGIGTTVPTKGKLNVLGSVAIGSTAYTETSGAAPTNGLIVEGNVGIGTTNPDRQLKIVTSGDTAPGFSVDGSSLTYNEIFELLGTLPTNPSTGRALTVGIATEAYSRGVFYNDGTLGIGPGSSTRDVFLRRSTTNTMMIDSNMSGGAANFVVTGNVGIGTASPSTFKLEVAGSVGPSADNTYDLGSSGRRWANIYGTNIYGNITPTGFTQGSVIFAGAGGTLSQNNANFFWDNTNLRLGIGTNTPSVSIDSTGSLRLTAGTFQIGNAANVAYNRIGTNATNRGLSAASDLLINGKLEVDQAFFPDSGIYGSSGGLVVSFPNNDAWFSDEVWIDGKLGIGTTAPANKLSVIGGVNIGSNSYNVTAPTNGLIVEGNVGIGTTAPGAKLTVADSAGALDYVTAGAGNVHIGTQLAPAGTAGEVVRLELQPYGHTGGPFNLVARDTASSAYIDWRYDARNLLTIQYNGNVGIGTAGPGAKLSITTTGTELSGTAASATLKTMAGNLGTTAGNTLKLASFGFLSSNNSSLGIEALRTANGTDWTTTAIGLKMDVDNTSPVNNAQIWLTNSGNVGIGTTNPTSKLTVDGGGVSATHTSSVGMGLFVTGSNGGNGMSIASFDNSQASTFGVGNRIRFGGSGTNANVFGIFGVGDQLYASINRLATFTVEGPANSGGQTRAIIPAGTAFSYYTDWPTGWGGGLATWDINSAGIRYSSLNQRSDIRLKKNIQYLKETNYYSNSLSLISKLKAIEFEWKDEKLKGKQFGYIAQEVQEIFPDLVLSDSNGYLGVNYISFIPFITNAIQEQQTQIEELKNNLNTLNKDLSLNSSGDLIITQDQQGAYQVQRADGSIVDRIANFAENVVGKIKAGVTEAQEITTNGFLAFQAQIDNLLVKTGLVSPQIQTAMISPLANEKDIVIRLGNSATPGESSTAGKLSIQDQNGQEVASIDSEGNASFSGELKSKDLAVENNATVSGELTANKVSSDEVIAQKIYADQIVAKDGTIFDISTTNLTGVTLEQIESLLREAQADQELLQKASDWNIETASQSAKLANIETANIQNLFVTNSAALTSLSVSNSLTLGTDFIISNNTNNLVSINTLSSPLSIQSLALAPVEIMAGKIRIETNGDVYIAGNLYVAGRVESTGLTVKTSADMTRTDLVRVEDEAGNLAAGISASGSAQFKELASDKIVIAGASVATDSATLQNGEINTNASAGSGILPAGQKEIAIVSPNIKSESLVYVTPTSDTKNYVLYVKAKEDGRMVVGFNRALDIDVYFNWWVIAVKN